MKGLTVRENSKTVATSTNSHLLVDSEASPPHFDVVTIPSPAAITHGGATSTSVTVLEIPHGLTYTPFVDCYFWPATATTSGSDLGLLGDYYYHNFYSFINLGAPLVDQLDVKANETHLRVIYTYTTFFGGGTSSPHASKMKYTIFSNEGYRQP